MFSENEIDYEKWEYEESLENAKDYEIPNLGDIVTVELFSFPPKGDEDYLVVRTDYTTNYVDGEEIKSKHPVIITAVKENDSIKNATSFHVCNVKKITNLPKDLSDELKEKLNKMIESQIPKIGKTAIVKHNSILQIAKRRLGRDDRKVEKFKIVGIRERNCEPLLILKPTKHFNQKYLELSLGHCYIS